MRRGRFGRQAAMEPPTKCAWPGIGGTTSAVESRIQNEEPAFGNTRRPWQFATDSFIGVGGETSFAHRAPVDVVFMEALAIACVRGLTK